MAGKSKIVRGALDALTDITRRDFIKGAGATAATGALTGLKAAPKLFDDLVPVTKKAVKAIPQLPKSIYDLQSLNSVYDNFANRHWRENLDMYDEVELEEIASATLDNLGKSFKDFGVVKNDYRSLLFNDKFLKESNLSVDSARSQTGIELKELLTEDSENIMRWINDEIPLDEVMESSESAAFDVLTELMEKYKLTKPQIKKYLKENNIFDDERNRSKFWWEELPSSILKIIDDGPLYKDSFPGSFLTDPKSWRVKNAKFQGMDFPFIEHKETQDQIEIPSDSVNIIKEYVKGKLKD